MVGTPSTLSKHAEAGAKRQGGLLDEVRQFALKGPVGERRYFKGNPGILRRYVGQWFVPGTVRTSRDGDEGLWVCKLEEQE